MQWYSHLLTYRTLNALTTPMLLACVLPLPNGCILVLVAPVGRRQEDEPLSGLNTGLIVALIVVSIVLGVVGFLVGMIVGKKRYMSPTPHLDQELTNKNKEADALKNQNCSDYQLPPGKPSNLQVQYQNNLHGNNTIVDGQGETTLQRQKKVYVWANCQSSKPWFIPNNYVPSMWKTIVYWRKRTKWLELSAIVDSPGDRNTATVLYINMYSHSSDWCQRKPAEIRSPLICAVIVAKLLKHSLWSHQYNISPYMFYQTSYHILANRKHRDANDCFLKPT